ncbi:MAG: B12-binding domain-containing radical SAM protein [Acetobacteraceae bacterium]|nr:B12-binding domain-containing radical SAM protein [Acetobacteraceae bacterium]
MRVLLVNPPWPYHAFRHSSSRFAPPLGLASLAAVLERAGARPSVLDMAVMKLSGRDIAGYLQPPPRLVGISLNMSFTEPGAVEAARTVRALLPEAALILGGNHATFEHRRLLDTGVADAVCLYEGETAIVEAVRRLDRGEPLSGCPGLAVREGNGRITVGPQPEPVHDLDSLPPPARHLLPMHLYDVEQQGLVGSARGCPFGCTFCSASAFSGTRVRTHSPRRVVEEIASLGTDYGVNKVLFCDDTFVLSRRRLEELCRLLGSSGLGVRWACNTRADSLTRGVAEMLRDSGCTGVLVGIESCTQEVLDRATKGIKVEQAWEAVRNAQAAGLEVYATFIVGLPGETLQSLEASCQFIRTLRPDRVTVSMLTPFPGTAIRERARELGVTILGHDFSRYELTCPTCETDTMSVDDLKRGYVKMILAVQASRPT